MVEARAGELLEVLGLAEAAGTLVVDYSHGMRKKIALASALLHAPRVLFLDEPFEAIDPVSARTIRGLLERYTAGGATVVFSSHVMELVERLCDRVGIMHLGRPDHRGPDRPGAGRAQPRGRLRRAGGREPRRRRGAGLAGHLVGLKLALLRNGLRRSNWAQQAALALGALAGLPLAFGGFLLLALVPRAEPRGPACCWSRWCSCCCSSAGGCSRC